MLMMRARVQEHRWVDHPAAAVMEARVPGQWVDRPAAMVMEAREQGRCWIDHPAAAVMEARVQGRHWVDRPSDAKFHDMFIHIILEPRDFIPWNNEDNIVSFETEDLIRRLHSVVFVPILFLIGAPANVINMAVFHKQGLKERINVCLFALSLADFCYLTCVMVLYAEQLYLQFTTKETFGPVYRWIANQNLLGFYGFTWVSQVLSAIIASERCFCIFRPLRSHTILRTSTTTAVIIIAFIIIIGVYFVVASRYYIICAYDPITDSVIMTGIGGEFYYRHKNLVDFLDGFIYGVGLPWVMIIIVTSTTIVTAVKLRQAAKWRAGISSRGGDDGGGDGGGMSVRDIALTKMLVYNSVFFIICVFPIGLFRFILFFMPEMNAGRRNHNFFVTCLWILNITSYINATFNFLIYYTMGSRYRQTLRGLPCFRWCMRGKTHTREGGKEGNYY
ncbi:hypothetical protein ACOMHN_043244 [Nucella lapillus]